jgi:uncharacterized membrane protein
MSSGCFIEAFGWSVFWKGLGPELLCIFTSLLIRILLLNINSSIWFVIGGILVASVISTPAENLKLRSFLDAVRFFAVLRFFCCFMYLLQQSREGAARRFAKVAFRGCGAAALRDLSSAVAFVFLLELFYASQSGDEITVPFLFCTVLVRTTPLGTGMGMSLLKTCTRLEQLLCLFRIRSM